VNLRHLRLLAGISVVLCASVRADAVEVKLTAVETAKVERKPALVTSGVPFARGAVKDVKKLSVSLGGKLIPAQFLKTAKWSDGSVRWALMDCQVPVAAGGKAQLVVRDDGRNPAPAAAVKIDNGATVVTVSTGPMKVVIDKQSAAIFKSIKVDGKELVTAKGRGLVIWAECPSLGTIKCHGRPSVNCPKFGPGKPIVAEAPSKVEIEQAGPMRAIITLRGKFPQSVHKGLAGYTVRIYAYAGAKRLKLHVWLENAGRHGYASRNAKKIESEWMVFDGLALELGLSLGGGIKAECEGASASGKFRVFQGVKTPKGDRGPAYRLADMFYTVKSGAKELKRGERTDGVVALSGSGGKLTACIRDFWENYEKAIELEDDKLRLWLWPLDGQWPRRWNTYTVAQYAAKMMSSYGCYGAYKLPGSVHKGHQIALDFSGREAKSTHADLDKPIFPLCSADYYASTEAAPALFAPPATRTGDEDCDQKLVAWNLMTRNAVNPESKFSLWEARRRTSRANFWYGWMDFGDIVQYGRGYTNLAYDWPWLMQVNLLRTGDLNYLRLTEDMVQHRIDVDQQWSDREAGYKGLQRASGRYSHFHCERFTRGHPHPGHNWLAGVVFWYMLSGEPKALECAQRNAAGLSKGWASLNKSRSWTAGRAKMNMQSVARALFSFSSMYALDGEEKWLDEAMKLVRYNVAAKAKAHGPHLHARRQIKSQGYTRDDIKYCYSLYALCLLHHYSNDKKLFELLKAGADKDFPENFFDAPLFLADLHAYVALKTGKSDYADDAVEHWIEASPESKELPVYQPGNSKWTERKSMHMRAGNILQWYFWKKSKKK
jgi:PcRGLX-like protein central beta sandwich domain/PcRGLX-like N-terminal RIFT barrel domain